MTASRSRRTATTKVVTQINRTAVLDALRDSGPVTRRRLSDLTGLSSATIERLVGALLREGLIEQDGVVRQAGGRPSTLLKYSGGRRSVVVLEVSAEAVRSLTIGLDGDPLGDVAVTPLSDWSSRHLTDVIEITKQAVAHATDIGGECLGVGVTVPGIVHRGLVAKTAELGWQNVPLEQILRDQTKLPVLVMNDANAIAYGEWRRGAARELSTVASLVLGSGLGSGIVNDGHLYLGARSAAGEVGFLFGDVTAMRRYFTDHGDLESRMNEIARRISPGSPTTASAVRSAVEMCASGDAPADEAELFFDLLAFGAAAISIAFDTEALLLAGAFEAAPQHCVAEIERRLVGRIASVPTIMPIALGSMSALTGVGESLIRIVREATYLA